MWRAMFLAAGLYTMILGAECLAVEQVKLKLHEDPPPAPQSAWPGEPPKAGPPMVLAPPRWAPWSLMSVGAVVCLYSFTIPRRIQGK